MTYVLERPNGFIPRGMLEEDDSLEETVARACDAAVGAYGWRRYRVTVNFEAARSKPHVRVEVFLAWWQSMRFEMERERVVSSSRKVLLTLGQHREFPYGLRLVVERQKPS